MTSSGVPEGGVPENLTADYAQKQAYKLAIGIQQKIGEKLGIESVSTGARESKPVDTGLPGFTPKQLKQRQIADAVEIVKAQNDLVLFPNATGNGFYAR